MTVTSRATPTYDLSLIKKLLERPDTRIITQQSYCAAVSLGYAGAEEIVDVVRNIQPSDFYKSMESVDKPGLWQDVYRPCDRGVVLYVKLQLSKNRKGVVIQFKRK